MAIFLQGLSRSSRWLRTPVKLDDRVSPGRLRFERWRVPNIDMTTFDRHTVTQEELGRIDLIAFQWLNDSTLWWAIAIVNNLANPFEDLATGMILKIPKLESITSALAEE